MEASSESVETTTVRTAGRRTCRRHEVRRLVALWCALTLWPAVFVLAEAPLDPGLRERVETHLVEIEILAFDRSGDPVTDLRPEDLVVKQDGDQRTIAVFEKHRGAPPEGPVPDARIHFQAPDGRQPRVTEGRETTWIVFFIDLVHGDLRTRKQLDRDAKLFVREGLPEGAEVAVLAFDGELRLMQSFTSDVGAIEDAIDAAFARPALPVSWEARMRDLLRQTDACQDSMIGSRRYRSGRECMDAAVRSYIRETEGVTERFVDALDATARFASGVEGRKFVFAFTHGASLDPVDEAVEAVGAHAGANWHLQQLRFDMMEEVEFRRDFYDMIERAVRGDVTLFTLDGSPQPTADMGATTRAGNRGRFMPYTRAFQEARHGLEEAARGTGGMFFGDSDFLTSMEKALAATEGAYTVGYYMDPASVKKLDKAVKVNVKSSRKGVRIRARDEYYFRSQAGEALLGRVELGEPEPLGDHTMVPFAVTLDPMRFERIETETEVAVNFTMHMRLLTTRGVPVSDSFHFLNHAFEREVFEEGTLVAPRYEGFLELPKGDYVFAVTIRDPQAFARTEIVETIEVEGPGEAKTGDDVAPSDASTRAIASD